MTVGTRPGTAAVVEGRVVTVVVCDVTPEGPFQNAVTLCLVPSPRFGMTTVLTPDGWYTVIDEGESVPETTTSAVVVPTGDEITNYPVVLVSAVDDTIDGVGGEGMGAASKSHCGYSFVFQHDGSSRNDPSFFSNLVSPPLQLQCCNVHIVHRFDVYAVCRDLHAQRRHLCS